MKIEDFCEFTGVRLQVLFPDVNGNYYATFTYCDFKETKDDLFITGITGRGKDPMAAINDFFKNAKGKYVKVDDTCYKIPSLEL